MELPLQDPPYLLCRLQDRPIDGMILESHRAELTPRTIRHLFEPAAPRRAGRGSERLSYVRRFPSL